MPILLSKEEKSMNFWPTRVEPLEGSLYIIDAREKKVIFIINNIYDVITTFYKPDEIEEELKSCGLTFSDLTDGHINELENLDIEKGIYTVFMDA